MSSFAYRRARRAFWILVAAAVLLAGAISWLAQRPAGPWTGTGIAVLGILATADIALAGRLLLALTGRLPAAHARPGRRRSGR